MPKPESIPLCPSKPVVPRNERQYQIELITPLFGGGVETRINDSSFPIRPAAIRGQLQFWWRATVGAQYATRQELRAAQSLIWGDTSQASQVQVLVKLLGNPSKPSVCAVIRPNQKGKDQVFWEPPFQNSALSYALFPFQGKIATRSSAKVDPASCIHKASFKLSLICSSKVDFERDVKPALWAWINFGGLGSRTRRGCGSIFCKDFAPENVNDLRAKWKEYMPEVSSEREWPTVAECVCVRIVDQPGDPIRVWDRLIGLFRHFRQGEGVGRNRGQQSNRPGRSRFSEPETIRRVTDQRSSQHVRLPLIPDDAFPRAEFGLPIVFHFQGQGEPSDTVLYPCNDSEGNKRERMASPLILKPLALQGETSIPLILRLKAPSLTGVDLRQGDAPLPLPNPTLIRDPRLSSYPNSPLAKSPNGSALDAFLAYAQSEGFTEVTR